MGEIGPSFDIPDLWSFWARGILSLLIIRAPLVQRMYLSGQRKMDFLSTFQLLKLSISLENQAAQFSSELS